jgi:two-component system, sensor histidine kinase and response regulator
MSDVASARILVVDAQLENLTLLSQMLQRKGYEVLTVLSGSRALDLLKNQMVDLILMDVNMPEENGYDICFKIKEDVRFRDVPVIFVSAIEDTTIKIKAFQAGGVDYITRPYQVRELLARVQAQINIRFQQQQATQSKQEEITQLYQKNQLKDDFLRMVTHDIQNPLSVIVSYTELLKRRDPKYWVDNARSGEYIEIIKSTALKMAQFVADMLDLARIEAHETITREMVSVGTLLNICIEDVRVMAEQKRINLIYDAPDATLQLFLAQQLFSQVVLNLLTNAIKYTNEGGEVRLYTVQTENNVQIVVKDTGIGIPTEALSQVFERFFRVDTNEHRSRSGSGLGLSIVKMIVEQHGGTIEVISETGKGSQFTVTINRLPI